MLSEGGALFSIAPFQFIINNFVSESGDKSSEARVGQREPSLTSGSFCCESVIDSDVHVLLDLFASDLFLTVAALAFQNLHCHGRFAAVCLSIDTTIARDRHL